VREQPILNTARLVLHRFALADAPDVQRLAGERDIARYTLSIPHPYVDGMAEQWIGSHEERLASGQGATFAISLSSGGLLIGAIGLEINQEHHRAELGYWIGKPYWGQGYCTEAARAVVRFAFEDLRLNRVHASHFSNNPASGRVMQKIGMRREASLRQHIHKWGEYEDLEIYALLKDDPRQSG
jgi:RimJ/RimL family protein N-acetyltransferase